MRTNSDEAQNLSTNSLILTRKMIDFESCGRSVSDMDENVKNEHLLHA